MGPAEMVIRADLDAVVKRSRGVARQLNQGVTHLMKKNKIAVPEWFVAALPPRPLDGELWMGRGRFEQVSGVVRRETADDAAWRAVRYMLFDLPGDTDDFSRRVERMAHIVETADVPWLQVVPQRRLADRAALKRTFDEVVAGGGEGLMLHRADAHWVAGRSDALLKMTPWLDAEATVVGHVPGRGRQRGRLGALQVRMQDGRQFRLGSGFSDAQRTSPPAIGSEVTYRYRALTAQGVPRFPVFLRVRDLP